MNMHVPMNQVAGAPNVAMQMPVPGPIMQQQSPQQMQPAPVPQQTQQDKMDNISKVKSLMGSLRESIPVNILTYYQVDIHSNKKGNYSSWAVS